MHNLWVDGISLKEFGICVSGENTFNAPETEYETVSIPGRSGDLIIRKNRMKNINVSYPAFITSNFAKNAASARLFLFSGTSYRKIEDDYHTDTYRMGFFAGPLDFDMKFLNWAGEVSLVFNCKPQRFLKYGEYPISVLSGQKLFNQWMPAMPLIHITGTGNGELIIGSSTVEITGMGGNITIDCDTQNAYDGTTNLNNTITVSGDFPVLDTGETAVSFSGGITAVKIIPRWWTV